MKKTVVIILIFLLGGAAYAQDLTYYKDIAPLVKKNCAPCHHPGGGAPFSLLTYEDVKKRSSFIKDVVQSRYMPPWRADNDYVHFANDRSLSENEIKTIVKWMNNKTPKGNPDKAQEAETVVVSATKYNRKPDLILKVEKGFTVKGDNEERFVVFKIPFELKESAEH